jgi:lysine biosynthesis protein LysW
MKMSLEKTEESFSGNCPICEALVSLEGDVEESEILSCPDCQSVLVVELRQGNNLILAEAPEIEEDWGE